MPPNSALARPALWSVRGRVRWDPVSCAALRRRTVHEVGLIDLLDMARLEGCLPRPRGVAVFQPCGSTGAMRSGAGGAGIARGCPASRELLTDAGRLLELADRNPDPHRARAAARWAWAAASRDPERTGESAAAACGGTGVRDDRRAQPADESARPHRTATCTRRGRSPGDPGCTRALQHSRDARPGHLVGRAPRSARGGDAESIEVTRMPQILMSDTDEIAAGARALRAQITAPPRRTHAPRSHDGARQQPDHGRRDACADTASVAAAHKYCSAAASAMALPPAWRGRWLSSAQRPPAVSGVPVISGMHRLPGVADPIFCPDHRKPDFQHHLPRLRRHVDGGSG